MSVVTDFYNLVDRGKEGKNVGIATGLDRLDEYTEGLSQGTSYLIGGASGAGKTSYVLYSLLYKPLMSPDCEEKDLHYLMGNWEMTHEQILAKLLSIYIHETYGAEMTFKDIFSRGKDVEGNPNIISEEEYTLLKECKPILEKFASRIEFIPNARTYDAFEEKCFQFLEKFGTFENPFGRFDDNVYHPNNPDQIVVIMADHLNLVKSSGGSNKKKVIDDISNMCVRMRNMCKIVSPALLMQLNRGGMDGNRIRADLMEPCAEDFKDSGTVNQKVE